MPKEIRKSTCTNITNFPAQLQFLNLRALLQAISNPTGAIITNLHAQPKLPEISARSEATSKLADSSVGNQFLLQDKSLQVLAVLEAPGKPTSARISKRVPRQQKFQQIF